jgi:hypothetical protein
LDGSVILGDSHEYADAKNADDLGFDLNMEIDEFMIMKQRKSLIFRPMKSREDGLGCIPSAKQKIFSSTVLLPIFIL